MEFIDVIKGFQHIKDIKFLHTFCKNVLINNEMTHGQAYYFFVSFMNQLIVLHNFPNITVLIESMMLHDNIAAFDYMMCNIPMHKCLIPIAIRYNRLNFVKYLYARDAYICYLCDIKIANMHNRKEIASFLSNMSHPLRRHCTCPSHTSKGQHTIVVNPTKSET